MFSPEIFAATLAERPPPVAAAHRPCSRCPSGGLPRWSMTIVSRGTRCASSGTSPRWRGRRREARARGRAPRAARGSRAPRPGGSSGDPPPRGSDDGCPGASARGGARRAARPRRTGESSRSTQAITPPIQRDAPRARTWRRCRGRSRPPGREPSARLRHASSSGSRSAGSNVAGDRGVLVGHPRHAAPVPEVPEVVMGIDVKRARPSTSPGAPAPAADAGGPSSSGGG